MALAAEHICLSTSSRRRMQRMMLPTRDKYTNTQCLVCESLFFDSFYCRSPALIHTERFMAEYGHLGGMSKFLASVLWQQNVGSQLTSLTSITGVYGALHFQ